MPRQRTHHRRDPLDLPDDFPERLRRFQQESRMSWSETARRLETYRSIVWRWKEGLARPKRHRRGELPELAEAWPWATGSPITGIGPAA